MSQIYYSSHKDLQKIGIAELARQKPEIDPTIFGSFSNAFITAGASMCYSVGLTVRDLEKQAFVQDAEGEFLDKIGAYDDLERLDASGAFGFVSAPATAGTVFNLGTVVQAVNGNKYSSQSISVASVTSISIVSLVRSGNTVTATTSGDHTFATGLEVDIDGADQSDYNGTFPIVVTGRDEFTYTIDTTPVAATGTITASSEYASIEFEAEETGASTNLSGGASLSLSDENPSIAGFDGTAYAQFDGLSGGAETEKDDAYRNRILLSRSIIEGVFTPDQIRLAALGINGNTRVFVVKPSLGVCDTPEPGFVPLPGQVAVYVLRDNDDNIIPTQIVLDKTKTAIIENGKLPGNTYEGDVYVFAPALELVDFVFSELDPNTETMRSAVNAQLDAFFEDSVEFQTDITLERILGSIDNTIDLTTGQRIKSFALTSPSADIEPADGEIPAKGDVTFP